MLIIMFMDDFERLVKEVSRIGGNDKRIRFMRLFYD